MVFHKKKKKNPLSVVSCTKEKAWQLQTEFEGIDKGSGTRETLEVRTRWHCSLWRDWGIGYKNVKCELKKIVLGLGILT